MTLRAKPLLHSFPVLQTPFFLTPMGTAKKRKHVVFCHIHLIEVWPRTKRPTDFVHRKDLEQMPIAIPWELVYSYFIRRFANMPKPNHKYRVSVYLGKEMFNELDQLAKLLGVSVSTITRVLISTGYEISKSIEGGANYGSK